MHPYHFFRNYYDFVTLGPQYAFDILIKFPRALERVSERFLQRRVVAIFQFGNSHGAEPSRSSDRYEATGKPSLTTAHKENT